MEVEKKEEYYDLMHRFFDGGMSDDDLTRLKLWLEQDSRNIHIFDQENELWQLARIGSNPKFYKTNKSWSDISSKLGIGKKNINLNTFIRRYRFKLLVAAASVSILVAIGSSILWLAERTRVQDFAEISTKVILDENQKTRLILPDSTEVTLNVGSKLEYNGNYGKDSRVVNLLGEAFFSVKTNPQKPFVVQLNGMKVCATGTKFNVCSFNNDDRNVVTLEEGKVRVSIDGLKPIDLNAGQQVVYFTESKNALVQYVSTDTYSSWKEDKLKFVETPLEDVLRILGRKYNVEFKITSTDVLKVKFTATIVDESIEDVMAMFSAVSSITYKFERQKSNSESATSKRNIIVGKKPPKSKLTN